MHTWFVLPYLFRRFYFYFQHDYEEVRAFSYRDSEVVIVCFSINDADSLQNIKDVWIEEAKSHVKRKKPILLIGCQSDVRQKRTHSSDNNNVTREEGEAFAKEIGAEAYLECSSLTMDGVTEVFSSVVNLALKNRKKKSRILSRLLRR